MSGRGQGRTWSGWRAALPRIPRCNRHGPSPFRSIFWPCYRAHWTASGTWGRLLFQRNLLHLVIGSRASCPSRRNCDILIGSSTIGVTVIGRTGIAGIGPGRNPGGPIIEGPIIVAAAAGGPISCMPGGIPAIMRGGLACHCDIMCICGGNIGIPGCHGAAAAAARTWLWCSSSCRTSKRPWVRCNRARRPAMARGGDVTTGETGELQKIF